MLFLALRPNAAPYNASSEALVCLQGGSGSKTGGGCGSRLRAGAGGSYPLTEDVTTSPNPQRSFDTWWVMVIYDAAYAGAASVAASSLPKRADDAAPRRR